MNPISSVIKIHYRDKWGWFYIPVLILFSSFGVNLVISYLVTSEVEFYTGGIASIFIFIFIAGIVTVAKTFPFALGMSIRRSDFYVGTVTMGLMTSILFACLVLFLAQLENVSNGWGSGLHFFHFPYVNDGTILEQFSIYTILFAHLFFLGFFIGSFAKRLGGKGMLILSLAVVLIGSIAVYMIHIFEVWGTIFSWFAGKTAIQIASWLVPFVLLYLLGSYLLMRRTTI